MARACGRQVCPDGRHLIRARRSLVSVHLIRQLRRVCEVDAAPGTSAGDGQPHAATIQFDYKAPRPARQYTLCRVFSLFYKNFYADLCTVPICAATVRRRACLPAWEQNAFCRVRTEGRRCFLSGAHISDWIGKLYHSDKGTGQRWGRLCAMRCIRPYTAQQR